MPARLPPLPVVEMRAAHKSGQTISQVAERYGCSRATVTRLFKQHGLAEPPVHLLSEIDADRRVAVCAKCGPVAIAPERNGGWRCAVSKRRKPYLVARGDSCERCGFVPENLCQLDVHHLDGNGGNNDLANLQTLCANCHRLVTFLGRHSVTVLNRNRASRV